MILTGGFENGYGQFRFLGGLTEAGLGQRGEERGGLEVPSPGEGVGMEFGRSRRGSEQAWPLPGGGGVFLSVFTFFVVSFACLPFYLLHSLTGWLFHLLYRFIKILTVCIYLPIVCIDWFVCSCIIALH